MAALRYKSLSVVALEGTADVHSDQSPNEAKSVDRAAVAAALDHAKIAEGPGGPAEMVPGQRHCKMKMYTAVAKGGNYEIVARSAGLVDPKEC